MLLPGGGSTTQASVRQRVVHAARHTQEAAAAGSSSDAGTRRTHIGGTPARRAESTGNTEEVENTEERGENSQDPATPRVAVAGEGTGTTGSTRARRGGAAPAYDETTRRARRPNRTLTGYVEGEGRRREPRLALTVRMSEAALDAVVDGRYEWRDGDLRKGRGARGTRGEDGAGAQP
jgi:hypothetical protein